MRNVLGSLKLEIKTLPISVKIESRLTLFYLANDVIQHSKRRHYEFVDSWGTSLQKATTLVRDDKVREKISRIFNIWEQREIYSEEFIADLHGLLAINANRKQASLPIPLSQTPSLSTSPLIAQRSDDPEDDFQLSGVVMGIRNCVSLESETDKNLKIVVKTQVPDMEKTLNNLKGMVKMPPQSARVSNASFQIERTSMKCRKTSRMRRRNTSFSWRVSRSRSAPGRFYSQPSTRPIDSIETKEKMSRKSFM